MTGNIWHLPSMTLDQRQAIMRTHLATLQDCIARNMALARLHGHKPHMVRLYVSTARWQNREILAELKLWRRMEAGASAPPRPPRRAYVPTRPGEAGYAPIPRSDSPNLASHSLKPLEVALSADSYASARERPLIPTPWPEVELVQGALF